jgi:uncharacterized protein YndB with AHSA1/START domain
LRLAGHDCSFPAYLEAIAEGIESMKGKFQFSVRVEIDASPKRVWEVIDDITLIPQFHPEVRKVDLVTGQKHRGVGVKYRCHILEGRKGNCVEEVVEYTPNEKFATGMPEDSWGLSEMLAEFVVETIVLPQDSGTTILQFDTYYDPVGIRNVIMNSLILRRAFKKKSISVMDGIKRLAERK